jgi:O-acetyl-ADP-ribose deacetylase (regulator of RNase III)
MYKIELRQGNMLEDVSSQIMINPSNTSLLLGSGVSMAFKRKFGAKLQDDMNMISRGINYKLQQGDVVVSNYAIKDSAVKYIYHAIVMNYTGSGPKSPSLHQVSLMIKNIKRLANSLHGDKICIAIPFIGCGAGGLKVKDIINIYMDACKDATNKEIIFRVYGYTRDDCMIAYKELNNG